MQKSFHSVPVNNDHPSSTKKESITKHAIAVAEEFTLLLWYADGSIQDIRAVKCSRRPTPTDQRNDASIQTFSNSMKNLYSNDNDVSFKVTKLRDETREDAMGCLKDIIPLSEMFGSSVSDYFDDYETQSGVV